MDITFINGTNKTRMKYGSKAFIMNKTTSKSAKKTNEKGKVKLHL